jgi:hypothetical protein
VCIFPLFFFALSFFAFIFSNLLDAPFCAPFWGAVLDAAVSSCVALYVLLPCAVSVTSINMQLLWILDVLFV